MNDCEKIKKGVLAPKVHFSNEISKRMIYKITKTFDSKQREGLRDWIILGSWIKEMNYKCLAKKVWRPIEEAYEAKWKNLRDTWSKAWELVTIPRVKY